MIINILKFIGQCTQNVGICIKSLVKGDINLKNLINQAAFIGADSIGISLTITFVAGAVISLQVARQFAMTGADAYVGGLISIAMIREIAPVFAALAIGARAGTAISAEIANMAITEQLDAMKTLKVNPISYLVLPRVIASTLMVPLVTILSELIGIIGGMWISFITINMHPNRFINSVWLYSNIFDIKVSLVKAAVFGFLIALISATHGLNTKGGASEVGNATTKAAIWSTIIVLIADYILTWIFYS